MSRIHGDKKIERSNLTKVYVDYHSYRPYLEDDFYGLCGYCGKHSKIIRHPFEIDHFVPKTVDSSRINEYNNLVFSCKICNRAKWDKWPTKDKYLAHNGKQGFIDPATDEYDKHLKRDGQGNIVALTEIGKYMIKELKFDIRPIASIWKAMELEKRLVILTEKIEKEESYKKLKEYHKVSEELRQLLYFLLDGGK